MPNLISSASRVGLAAVEVFYGGQQLYPAPMIDFSRQITRNSVDAALSQTDTYNLKGMYFNISSGLFYHVVVSGMNTLKQIFSQDGLEFQVRAGAGNIALPSGTLIVSGVYPFVSRIGIPTRDDQFIRFDYEVELTSKISVSGASGITSQSSDSWQCDEDADNGSTKLTHKVSAVGVNTNLSGVSNALTNAQVYVYSKLGTGNLPSNLPAFCSPPSGMGTWTLYEFIRSRSESFDSQAGSYEAGEVFVLISGVLPFTHTRTFEWTRDSNGIINVVLQGTIQGGGRTDGTNTKYNAFNLAQSGWLNTVLPGLINDASGVYLAYGGSGILAVGNPTSRNITENRFLGTISYSYTMTDDPVKNLPSGIVEQSLSIKRTEPIELVVRHVIPNRRLGSLVQRIGTPTDGSISITATAKAYSTGNPIVDTQTAMTYLQNLINQHRPNPADYISLELVSVEPEYDKLQLSASLSVVWSFSKDLVSANLPYSDILVPLVI